MWIARDKSGELSIFNNKPIEIGGCWFSEGEDPHEFLRIDPRRYGEISFEDSPVSIDFYTQDELDAEIQYHTDPLERDIESFKGQINEYWNRISDLEDEIERMGRY